MSGHIKCVFLLFFSACCTALVAQENKAGHLKDNLVRLSAIPRVAVPDLPFLQLNVEEIHKARQRVKDEPWAKDLLAKDLKIADAWLTRNYAYISDIIPEWGSLYIYGLGHNLDPQHQRRLKWCGWQNPRHVQAEDGTIYPNESCPDDGTGWTDPQTGVKYYFVAYANGMTVQRLETVELPALVNAFLLTENEEYALRALWILDGIASVYPRAYEGPIDYPGNAPGQADGGRLDRPYYQASRAMMNYAYFYEALSLSRYCQSPSRTNPPLSMFKNIETNLLLDGAEYCFRMTSQKNNGSDRELHNGNIDYNRSPMLVGALLGIPTWVEWSLNGPLGFRFIASNTIDINGRYYESSPMYATHTIDLVLSGAEILAKMKLPDYPDGYNAFNDERLAAFALNFFSDVVVAGHLPLFGDSGPDVDIIENETGYHNLTLFNAKRFYYFATNERIKKRALEIAAHQHSIRPGNQAYTRWELFKEPDWSEQLVKVKPNTQRHQGSTLLFDQGIAILRSRLGERERGALLRFGPTLNHGQADEMGLTFYANGREYSADPGYYNTHFRYGFTSASVAHNLLVVNEKSQLRVSSPGGEVVTWTDGEAMRSAEVSNPRAYSFEHITEYRRRIALVDISKEESYIIDVFWARGGYRYDYSLHGIFNGRLEVEKNKGLTFIGNRNGSVYKEGINYSADLGVTGRLAGFPSAPFYFSPPGGGYGFFQNPSYYSVDSAGVKLKWTATDHTGHQLYATHFPPNGSQLITTSMEAAVGDETGSPVHPMKLDYALVRNDSSPDKPIQYTTLILPTGNAEKITAHQLLPVDHSGEVVGIHVAPRDGSSDHYYYTTTDDKKEHRFQNGSRFRGREAFIKTDTDNKLLAASISGAGYIAYADFKLSAKPFFTSNLVVEEIIGNPLKVRVSLSPADAGKLVGNILSVDRRHMSRSFVLRVKEVEVIKSGTWLVLDALSNIQSIGQAEAYDDKRGVLTTTSRFPRVRSYIFGYDALPEGVSVPKYDPYNGVFNGWWLTNRRTGERSLIKTMDTDNTQIFLDAAFPVSFQPGDEFDIGVLAIGDELHVPVWGEAIRQPNGKWKFNGTASLSFEQ